MKLRPHLTRKRLIALLMLGSIAAALWGPPLARRVRPLAQVAFVPFSDGLTYLTTAVERGVKDAVSPDIPPEQARLQEQELAIARRENDYLRQYIRNLLAQRRDLEILSKDYKPVGQFAWRLIPARVIMSDALPYGQANVLSVGSGHGVSPGVRVLLTDRAKAVGDELPVVTTAALVGRVIESSAYTARMQLITDSGFRIKARVIREIDPAEPRLITVGSRVEKLDVLNQAVDVPDLRGDASGGMTIENVKAPHGIRAGDRVVTQDADYCLPASVAVGTVTEVVEYPHSPGFVKLIVAPAADLSALRDVYIVVPKPAETP